MRNAVYAAVCAISLLGTAASAQDAYPYGREGHMMALGNIIQKILSLPENDNSAAQKDTVKPSTNDYPPGYIPGREGRMMDTGEVFFKLFLSDKEVNELNLSVTNMLKKKHEAANAAAARQSEAAQADIITRQSAEIDELIQAKNLPAIIENISSRVYKNDKVLIYAIDATDKAKGPAYTVSYAVLTAVKEGPANEYAAQYYKKYAPSVKPSYAQ
jgi:hypothetical protein